MQTISFAEGNEQHLKDCKDALCRSVLGEKYFSSPGSAENAILEGIRQGNLYVAFSGEECVGIIITVSHDRYFLDRICDGLFVFDNNIITYQNGGYSTYIELSKPKETKSNDGYKQYREQKVRKVKLSFKENKEKEELELNIPKIEQTIKDIEEQMDNVSDYTTIASLTNQREELLEQLDEMSLRYMELLEKEEG